MLNLVKDRRFSGRWFRNYVFLLVGSGIIAAGYVLFIVPHKIVPGGIYGISIIGHHLLDLPTGITALVLNIPLLAWGIKELGPRFGIKTLVGQVLTSVQIDLYTFLWGDKPLSDDILVSSVFGGVCLGVGLGLVFKAKATTGGTDIIAQILFKRTAMPVGKTITVTSAVVVAGGIVAFRDPNLALYALACIFVTGKVLDAVLEGSSHQKAAFIISEKHQEIRETILNVLHRGGTVFDAKGLFQGDRRPVIMTAVTRRDLAILEEHVKRVDPTAFIVVFETKEILGRGFAPIVEADV